MLRVSVTMHPTALYHMITSTSRSYAYFFLSMEAERLGISGVWPQRRATPPITGRPAHRRRPLPTARCPLHPLVGRTAYRPGLTREGRPHAMEFTRRAPAVIRPGANAMGAISGRMPGRSGPPRAPARCQRPARARRSSLAGTPPPCRPPLRCGMHAARFPTSPGGAPPRGMTPVHMSSWLQWGTAPGGPRPVGHTRSASPGRRAPPRAAAPTPRGTRPGRRCAWADTGHRTAPPRLGHRHMQQPALEKVGHR